MSAKVKFSFLGRFSFFAFASLLLGALAFYQFPHSTIEHESRLLATGLSRDLQGDLPQSKVVALLEQQRYDEALNYLENLSRQSPNNVSATLLRANIYASYKGDFVEAKRLLQEAAKKYPNNLEIQAVLARLSVDQSK